MSLNIPEKQLPPVTEYIMSAEPCGIKTTTKSSKNLPTKVWIMGPTLKC